MTPFPVAAQRLLKHVALVASVSAPMQTRWLTYLLAPRSIHLRFTQ